MFYSVTSSINAGVNQTFSVTLLDTMIHLVIHEALLFNIFTRALYKIMQRDIFFQAIMQILIQLGILRPVSHYGYIRARII